MDMLLKPRKGRQEVFGVLSKLGSRARGAGMVSSLPEGSRSALRFLQVKTDVPSGALPLTRRNRCIFFFCAAVFCQKGLEVWLTLQHHRHLGVTLLDVHCWVGILLGTPSHPVTSSSSPQGPALSAWGPQEPRGSPCVYWNKSFLTPFFLFLNFFKLWATAILETTPCPAKKRRAVGRPGSTLSSTPSFVLRVLY